MNKNKKLVLIIAIILAVISTIGYFYFPLVFHQCILRVKCPISIGRIIVSAIPSLIFLYSISFLLFSIWTYFLKEEIFKLWLKFTYIWVPISMVYAWIGKDMRGNFYNGFIHKQTMAISMAVLYFVISLIIIIYKIKKDKKLNLVK